MCSGTVSNWLDGLTRSFHIPLNFLILTLLAGCNYMPEAGPSGEDVIQRQVGAGPDSTLLQRYETVEVSSAVVEILRHRVPDSFVGRFGDYRPSSEPVIGVGDTLTVSIYEAGAGGLFSPPLSTDHFTGSKNATIPEQVVGRDGAISVPYAGRIKVEGQTPRDVQTRIEKALTGKAIEPQALVTVSRSVSNSVTVTGEVVAGARVPLTVKGDRLLDVIATAGGVRGPVHDTFVQLSRGSTTVSLPLSKVVADPRENIYMRPGDIVTLVANPQVILAYGATGRNAEIPFDTTGISLARALAKMGGLLDSRSDASGVFIFRYEPEYIARRLRPDSTLIQPGRMMPMVYRLDMSDPNSFLLSQNFPMFNNDLVYVSNSPSTELQKVLALAATIIAPTASTAGTVAYAVK